MQIQLPPDVPMERKSGFCICFYQPGVLTGHFFCSFIPSGCFVGRKNCQLYRRSIGTFGEIEHYIRLLSFVG